MPKHYDEKDEHSHYNLGWGFKKIKKINRMQKELTDLFQSEIPSEWKFNHIRYNCYGTDDLSLVFLFERDILPEKPVSGMDLIERSRTYEKAVEDIEFHDHTKTYRPARLSKDDVNKIVQPLYRCTELNARYNEIHHGQGDWGYQVNVLFVELGLSLNSVYKIRDLSTGKH